MNVWASVYLFWFFFITVYVLSAWLAEKLSLTDPSQITNCSVTFSLRVTVKLRAASKVSEWPSALRKRHIYSFFFAKAYTEQTHSFIFVFRREPPLPRIAGEWVLEGPQCVYGYAKLLLAYMETKHETVLLDLRVSHPGCIMHQEHE